MRAEVSASRDPSPVKARHRGVGSCFRVARLVVPGEPESVTQVAGQKCYRRFRFAQSHRRPRTPSARCASGIRLLPGPARAPSAGLPRPRRLLQLQRGAPERQLARWHGAAAGPLHERAQLLARIGREQPAHPLQRASRHHALEEQRPAGGLLDGVRILVPEQESYVVWHRRLHGQSLADAITAAHPSPALGSAVASPHRSGAP
jgi:hypothetical protein